MLPFAVTLTTLDSTDWTPITAPIYCNNVALANKSGIVIYFRTTSTDPTTQDSIDGDGSEQSISGTYINNSFRYQPGSVICYAQAASATPVLIARFLQ
jgi:hypothetical protein